MGAVHGRRSDRRLPSSFLGPRRCRPCAWPCQLAHLPQSDRINGSSLRGGGGLDRGQERGGEPGSEIPPPGKCRRVNCPGVVHTECEQSVSASPCEGASEACGAISIQNAAVIGVYQHQGAVRRQNRGELDHGSSFIRRHAAAEDNRCGPDRSCTALRHNHVRSP